MPPHLHSVSSVTSDSPMLGTSQTWVPVPYVEFTLSRLSSDRSSGLIIFVTRWKEPQLIDDWVAVCYWYKLWSRYTWSDRPILMISKLLLISAYEMANSKQWIDYLLNGTGTRIWLPSCKKLSFTPLRRTRLCGLPGLRSLSMALCPGIQRLGCEVDRPPPFSDEIKKNTCIKTFIHACAVHS